MTLDGRSVYEREIEGMDFYQGQGVPYSKAEIGPLAFYAFGVGGEAGEVLEKVKKFYRDGNISETSIALELGDLLWYLSRMANLLGYSLSAIQDLNLNKLRSRHARGAQRGSGDDR